METLNQDFANIVAKSLNSHGHPFQHRLINALQNHQEARQRWSFQVDEFPVRVQGRDTRIDLILSSGLHPGSTDPAGVLIGECKRANPSMSNWIFFSTGRNKRRPVIESLCRGDLDFYTAAREVSIQERIYDLGLAIRSGQQGEPGGQPLAAIDDASTQVLRCTNGFLDYMAGEGQKLWETIPVLHFLPVIFTTARLYTSSTDFGSTDLASGNVSIDLEHLASVDWLLCDFPVSLGLRHSVRRMRKGGTLANARMEEFQRTVAIVNPAGLDDFVRRLFHFELLNKPA